MEYAIDFQSLFNSLFINFGMFAGLFTVLSLFPNFINNEERQVKHDIILGLIAGAAAALSILFSVEIMEGIRVDSRVTILTMTALFFNPTTALVATIPAILMRVALDGSILLGVIVIVFASSFGVFCRYIIDKHIETKINLRILAVVSMIIALIVPLISVPFIKPEDMHNVLTITMPAYILQSFISAFILGALLLINYKNYYLKWEVGIAQNRAEQINSAKTEFLAMMSHATRTPMNGVLGFTEILDQTDLDDYQKHCLKQIKTAGTTMMHLLNDILDFSKIDSGKFSLSNTPFNIPSNISSAIEVMRTESNLNNNKLLLNIADDVPEYIYGDTHRIRQIIFNLVGNALKVTEAGEVTLSLSRHNIDPKLQHKSKRHKTSALDHITPTYKRVGNISDADGILRITVKDTGIGIPFERQSHIFSAFEQAESGISRKYGGSGLGLAIVKKLVDLMGGSISLESAVGVGSIFTIELPYVVPSEDDIKTAESDSKSKDYNDDGNVASYTNGLPSKKAEPAVIGDNRLILLTEDIEMNQELAASMLMQNGFQVQIANNGKEAVEAVKNGGPFHLVLMDIRMPEMDGIEATEIIRKELKIGHDELPIVALTAHVLGAEIKDCLKAGMNDYISKPIKAELLLKKVAQWAIPAGVDSFDSLLSNDSSNIDILDSLYFHSSGESTEEQNQYSERQNNDFDDDFVTNPFANRTADDCPIIDDEMLNQFMEFMGKDKIIKVFEVFKEDIEIRFGKMADSQFELETIKNEAHALASTSGNLGMMKLSLTCRELVDNPETHGDLNEIIDQLHKLADESCAAFKEYVA